MIVDKLNELSDGQVVTAAAASTNTYDFGQASPTPGSNGVLHVVTTVEAGSTGLIQVKIQECDTEVGTYTDLLTGPQVTIPAEGLILDMALPAVTYTDLLTGPQVTIPAEGLILDMALPAVTKRFLRAYYTPTKASDSNAPAAKATLSTIITWGVEQQSGWKGSTAYMQTK